MIARAVRFSERRAWLRAALRARLVDEWTLSIGKAHCQLSINVLISFDSLSLSVVVVAIAALRRGLAAVLPLALLGFLAPAELERQGKTITSTTSPTLKYLILNTFFISLLSTAVLPRSDWRARARHRAAASTDAL